MELVNQHLETPTTTESYIELGQLFAIAKRLKDLLSGSEETPLNRAQMAVKGAERFFMQDYFVNQGGMKKTKHPEIRPEELRDFVVNIIISTPGLNGEGSAALIIDDILNNLIEQMGDNVNNERLKQLIQIANGLSNSPVSPELAYALFAFMSWWSSSKREGEFIYMDPLQSKLSTYHSAFYTDDINVRNMLENIIDMMWQFGSGD